MTTGSRQHWDGLEQALDVLHVKSVKVIINGRPLNPKGLAEKCQQLVAERMDDLPSAGVGGDNLVEQGPL